MTSSRRFFYSLIFFPMLVGCYMNPQSSQEAASENMLSGRTATPQAIYFPVMAGDRLGSPTPFQPMAPTAISTPTPPPTATSNPPLQQGVATSGKVEVPPPMPLLSDEESVNILLVGSDRRSGRYFRTDTLIILSLRPRQRSVTLLSIPRDLYVYIPEWTMQRINTAYLHGELEGYPGGGASLLKETILYNLGIKVDHFAIVDFNGFRNAIDILGGIDVPLACSFTDWHIIDPGISDQDPNNWEIHTIGPGLVHMDGDLALWYARSRLRSNDFDRGRRQQELLRAVYAKATSLNTVPHIPELYEKLSQGIFTDLSISDIFTFVPLGLNMEPSSVRSYFINDRFVRGWRTSEGAAVLLPRRKRVKNLVAKAMAPPSPDETLRQDVVVEIWDLSHDQNLGLLASERLHYAGFSTTIFSPWDSLPAPDQTTLLYDGTGEEDVANAILSVLGLHSSRLLVDPNLKSNSAYQLILRNDYDPCFNPAQLVH